LAEPAVSTLTAFVLGFYNFKSGERVVFLMLETVRVKVKLERKPMCCCRCGIGLDVVLTEEYWEIFEQEGGQVVCPNCLKNSEFKDEQEMYAQSPASYLLLSPTTMFDYLSSEKRPEIEFGYVYFIQSERGGPIKIGYTTNLERRIMALQTAQPYPLKLLLVIHGGVEEENKLHKKFNSLRLCGEWFSPDEKLLQYIEKLKAKSVKTLNLQ
jgi:hypothetical protein